MQEEGLKVQKLHLEVEKKKSVTRRYLGELLKNLRCKMSKGSKHQIKKRPVSPLKRPRFPIKLTQETITFC